jgi:hypothetical protein
MIERMRINRIIAKYDNDISLFFAKATNSEIETVLEYVALRANEKQQETVRQADLAVDIYEDAPADITESIEFADNNNLFVSLDDVLARSKKEKIL